MDNLIIIENKIYEIRGQKVMLDFDLAEMYEIETKRLKEQVKRNMDRFPKDFMFQLTHEEYSLVIANLRSQFATSSWGGLRHAPFAFTEQGVAMLSGILRSPKAIEVNTTSCEPSSVCGNIFFLMPRKKNLKNSENALNIWRKTFLPTETIMRSNSTNFSPPLQS